MAGLAFVPATVAIMVGDVVSGRAIPVFGTLQVSASGTMLMGAGCLTMFGLLSTRLSTPAHVVAFMAALVVALAIVGLGIGLIVPAMTSALLGSVDKSWSGIASGTLTAFRQTGSVLGVALFGSLLAGIGATAGLHTACAIAVGLMLVVAVLLVLAR